MSEAKHSIILSSSKDCFSLFDLRFGEGKQPLSHGDSFASDKLRKIGI